MSTFEADSATDSHGAHGHDHDHPKFLAHHFETPEQQYDSGKLGTWVFLVTEVLFFSGMFCAYAIFRMLRPEVFEGCSQFLNTKLGAINTGVLLFSSLTMAWAVRCAQTEEYRKLTAMLASTLSCAMIFLGVKAIEYSHKWEMGLLPAGMFSYDPAHPHHADSPNYLVWICLPFALALVGVVVWLISAALQGNKFQVACLKPLTVVAFSFFIGVGLGTFLESGDSGETHATTHHESGEHALELASTSSLLGREDRGATEFGVIERLAGDATNSGLKNELEALEAQAEIASGSAILNDSADSDATIQKAPRDFLTPSRAGVFFSIYYCMTGIHAIHILAGIGVLVWLLVRSVRQDFNRQYFGPVDYVGLYWHLVDLIWIYLFPLLYLIR
ncbi:cytochrome c oxidase subunit 3 [Novipirellula artificiosorum]|uniref:Cytochrome c oxidase subunit 3 n=1 Tax=Novipirellula artificiosorum TaxID=2528016 RepID=A0A5C6DRI1_9BACT|nr:cytochrome c oxidase subunit 3 [Novipirellula artificiosorum]TWU38467.1 Cytochrome c oxidase subunit 3 [Novipirellula artificiosorum]